MRWGRTWGIAMAIVIGCLGGYEVYLRRAGFVPTVPSRPTAWVVTRDRLRDTSTVVVGSSRIHALVDPVVWARAAGGASALQLATFGGATIPALEHLAALPSFRGLVLGDIVPFFTFDKYQLRRALVDELEAYRRTRVSPASRIEAYLRVYLPYQFVFSGSQVGLRQWVDPAPDFDPREAAAAVTLPNGYRVRRFRAAGVAANPDWVMTPATFGRLHRSVPSRIEFTRMRDRLVAAVDTIEARGGTVVLIYAPGCGGRRVVEEKLYPKSLFWDPIRAGVGQTVDLDDYPGFAALPCYDGSHLDVEDAAKVTEWLAGRVAATIAARPPRGAR